MGTVLIEESVLQDMLERIRMLENAAIKKPEAKPMLATLTTRKPLSTPRNIKDDEPVFGYGSRYDYDTWKAFTELARCFLKENDTFYMSTTPRGRFLVPYIRSTNVDKPRDLRLVDMDRLEAAAKMLDEMILVYNKHFAEAHKYVSYKPSLTGSEETQIIRVIHDPE